jgi:hypothetical protein
MPGRGTATLFTGTARGDRRCLRLSIIVPVACGGRARGIHRFYAGTQEFWIVSTEFVRVV